LYHSLLPKSNIHADLLVIFCSSGIDEINIFLTVSMVFPLLSGRKFSVTLQPLIDTASDVLKMFVLVCAVPVSVFAIVKISSYDIQFSRCVAAAGGGNSALFIAAYLTPFHSIQQGRIPVIGFPYGRFRACGYSHMYFRRIRYGFSPLPGMLISRPQKRLYLC